MKAETSRYTIVAITLHWVMAGLLLFMIWLGWNMDENEVRFQLHKSIGILILFLTLVRVIWRHSWMRWFQWGHKCRSSEVPARLPAPLKGWHGHDPVQTGRSSAHPALRRARLQMPIPAKKWH